MYRLDSKPAPAPLLGAAPEHVAGVAVELEEFVRARCAEWRSSGVMPEFVEPVLLDAVRGGELLRSRLVGLGWCCGARPDRAIVRVGAALELLHVFALIQDDVISDVELRRGRPAVHVRLARAHAACDRVGDARRFGASAAVLLADLCLVWAERLWRESGMPRDRLWAAWPAFDAMRTELALGQLAELLDDAATPPSLDRVLTIARCRSGDYTVRWPLELGAFLADCAPPVLAALRGYGGLVGEAFQLREDLLGVLGTEGPTGRPAAADLRAGRATSVVVLARAQSSFSAQRELDALARAGDLDETQIARRRELIVASGAPLVIERMIRDRVTLARAHLVTGGVAEHVATALDELTTRHVIAAGAPAGGRC